MDQPAQHIETKPTKQRIIEKNTKSALKPKTREQIFEELIHTKRNLKPSPTLCSIFANELIEKLGMAKLDILKNDVKTTLNFFDLLTKKRYLLFYLRHMRRSVAFKEANESNLFVGLKLGEMINKYFAFAGINDAGLNLPIEFSESKVLLNDVPCFLVFEFQGGETPVLISKILLRGIDSTVKEKEVINELVKFIEKEKHVRNLGSPDTSKEGKLINQGGSGVNGIKQTLNGPFVSKVSRQKELMTKVDHIKVKQRPLVDNSQINKIPKYDSAFEEEQANKFRRIGGMEMEEESNWPKPTRAKIGETRLTDSRIKQEREFYKKNNRKPG